MRDRIRSRLHEAWCEGFLSAFGFGSWDHLWDLLGLSDPELRREPERPALGDLRDDAEALQRDCDAVMGDLRAAMPVSPRATDSPFPGGDPKPRKGTRRGRRRGARRSGRRR
jgi:hypothetical protein